MKLGILDDHQLFRNGVTELLGNINDEFEFVFSSALPEELYSFLDIDTLDLLLLDIKLGFTNGFEVLEKLRSESNDLPIIMLTMHDQRAYLRKFVEAGANSYVLKSTSPQELEMTILKVLENGFYLNEKMTAGLVKGIKENSKINLDMSLSELEIETLILICEGFTAAEISKKLFKSPRTIEGYRQKLFDKTDSKNIASLVSWAYRNNVID